MRLRQRERKRSADLGANLLQTAIFRSNLTTSLVPSVGAGGPTWSRATKAWGFNELGYLEELASGCAFFGGARLVRNTVRTTSEDFSNAAWVKVGSITTPSANTLVCANATATMGVLQSSGPPNVIVGQHFLYGARVRYVSGGADFIQILSGSVGFGNDFMNVSLLDGTSSTTGGVFSSVTEVVPGTYDIMIRAVADVNAAGDYFSVVFATSLGSGRNQSFVGDGIKSFDLLRAWSVDVTGYDASYIPEYVSVGVEASPYFGAGIDGAKYFGTDQNGLALGRDKLLGFRRESAATNNLLYCRKLRQVNWTTSPTGAEFVVNGGFGADTDWTKETGWSIAAGVATKVAGTGGSLKQVILTTAGTTYYVEIVCTVSAGTLSVAVGASGFQTPNISASGTYTYKIIAGTGTQTLNVYGSATYAGTVDSVSVKEAVVQVTQATGLDGIANTATTLTATAVDAIILQPTSGIASADRCASAYVKRRTGTGTISFTQNGGSSWTDITSSINASTWSRVQITATLPNPSVGFKISTSGDEIDVDVVQNEAGSVATSPIVTTTATITRNSTSLTYQTASNIDLTVGTVYCGFKLDTSLYSGFPIACTADGRMIYSYLNDTRIANYDGVNVAYDTPPAYTSGRPLKIASAWGGATKSIGVDGRTPVASAFDGSMGSGATIDIGGGTSIGSAYIKSIAIYNYQMTDAQLQEVTK